MKSFLDVDNLLIKEYELLMKAQALNNLEQQKDIYLQAFTNEIAKATKQKGKKTYPVYSTFKQLFDYDKHREDILNEKEIQAPPQSEIDKLMLKANSKGG